LPGAGAQIKNEEMELSLKFRTGRWSFGHLIGSCGSRPRYRVPTLYWKSIELQNWFSRPWKSIEFGQNLC